MSAHSGLVLVSGLTNELLWDALLGGGGRGPECRQDQRAGDDRPGQDLPPRLGRNDDQVACQGELMGTRAQFQPHGPGPS